MVKHPLQHTLDSMNFWLFFKGRQTGGFKGGGFPDLELSLLSCPCFNVCPFGTFPIFPGFSRFARGSTYLSIYLSIYLRRDHGFAMIRSPLTRAPQELSQNCCPEIFPIRSFFLSRPIKSTYEEQSRKGPRHNLDLSRKNGKPPRGNPPSQPDKADSHGETRDKRSNWSLMAWNRK